MSNMIERGAAALQAGRMDEALASFNDALRANPNDGEALSLSGLALAQLGRAADAEKNLRAAVQREPNEISFRINLVQGLQTLRRFDTAAAELQPIYAIDAARGDAAAKRLAAAAAAHRDWAGLEKVAIAWDRIDTNAPAAAFFASRAAFEQGQFERAVMFHRQVMARGASGAQHLTAHAGLCLHALLFDEAEQMLRRAEAIDPDAVDMLSNRALLLTYQGRMDEAESYCRRALQRDPNHAPTYAILSQLKRGALSDADKAAVERISASADAPFELRIPAAFAAAHVLDSRDQTDAAFAAYQRAHAIAEERDKAEGRLHTTASVEQYADRVRKLKINATRGPAAPRPIFVLGMPRSGTTLVESVLATHSQVYGAGERQSMPNLLQAALDGRAISAPEYFAGLPAGVDRFTDKNPLNFWAVGLIAQLFPDAPIVHVRRNPVECGFSIYRQEFNKHWTFVHRLDHIAHYYGQYARMMAHWRGKVRMVEVQYEDFAANFDNSAPALVKACGLTWEEGCRNFQDSERPIATLSTVQARQPVTVSNQNSERYRRHIEPLVQALQKAGVDPRTGDVR